MNCSEFAQRAPIQQHRATSAPDKAIPDKFNLTAKLDYLDTTALTDPY